MYIHSQWQVAVHRGHGGSHESEPLVRLLLSYLMASGIPCRSSTSCGCEPLKFAADRDCLFPVSNTRIATANDSSGRFLVTNGVENIFLPDLTAQCLTQVLGSSVIFPLSALSC
jgi:hypothetical protein